MAMGSSVLVLEPMTVIVVMRVGNRTLTSAARPIGRRFTHVFNPSRFGWLDGS